MEILWQHRFPFTKFPLQEVSTLNFKDVVVITYSRISIRHYKNFNSTCSHLSKVHLIIIHCDQI